MEQLNVFLVEDSLIFRIGLKGLITMEARFNCVGESDNGCDALAWISRAKVDIIVLDLELPRMDGVNFLGNLAKLHLKTKVMILSQESQRHRVLELLDLGIDGHVLKTDDSSEILRGLHAIADGGRYFSTRMGAQYFDLLREQRLTPNPTISPREKQIARLIAEGKTNRDIAGALDCSEHTIKCHKANLMRKLGAQNSAEVVAWVARAGLLS